MINYNYFRIISFFIILLSFSLYSAIPVIRNKKPTFNSLSDSASNILSSAIDNNAPIIKVVGNQQYCPGTSLKIVTNVTITDSDDTGTDAIYIQIASGYDIGQDLLVLSNPSAHPSIQTTWNPTEGKLKLSSVNAGIQVLYSDFVAAIKDVEFSNYSSSASGVKTFSISVGQANYLPRNGHFYEFVAADGIYWSNAKAAAELRTYYGLRGYLVTITAEDEQKISSEQSSGTGWIGGSDEETEGVWKWVTGPENGLVFWYGATNGYTPNYAIWNSNGGEPNNSNNEDYAHITDPNLPGAIKGSWNDMKNSGGPNYYRPKGYIVEYGGMPGDPVLEIAASSTIVIPNISGITEGSVCDSGTVTLSATATAGTVNWYDAASGGNLLATADTYTTPILTSSQTYYVDAGCSSNRTAVKATVYKSPVVTPTKTTVSRCGAGDVILEATTNAGVVNWYNTPSGGSILATGTSYTIANATQNTTYYVEAISDGCSNGIRKAINVVIYTPPVVNNEEIILCKNSRVTLDASLSNMNYLWSTGATTQTIVVNTPGIYTVNVSSPFPENCSSTKTITVIEHQLPEINYIDVNETTVVIYVKKEEPYFEYSIDGSEYQDSNVFFNAPSGLQTAYVREINSCGIDSKPFIVLIVPKFFTPNADNYNDSWEVKGLINYPKAEVTIFDRYGKLITKLNASKLSWDGTYNNALLPATDYWYVLKIDSDAIEKRGHFSLKR